jgi:HK97 family phage major capsid protein
MLGVYVLLKPFGDMKEGEVVHLDDQEAQALLEAGLIEEAKAEDVEEEGGEEEAPEYPEEENAALVQRAVSRLKKNVEKDVAEKVAEKIASRVVGKTTKRPSFGSVPATVKEPVFKSFGHMLLASAKAHYGDHRAARMLQAYNDEIRVKSPLGANEGTAGQGGYAVKPEWADGIWIRQRQYPDLLGMTDVRNINSNSYNIVYMPETSLADGSRHGGTSAYWVSEGSTATSSYPATAQVTETLNTQIVLCYVTNQLLEDANVENFQRYVEDAVGLEFLWQGNQSVVQGSGSGQPTGILNQSALVTITKSSNDTSAMFGFDDLAKMNRALWEGSRSSAIWICNPEARAVLESLVFVSQSGTATTYPAFGGVSYNAADEFPFRIFGMPVVFCYNAAQLGAAGDIILADPKALITTQRPGLEVAVSTELQFATYQTAFRFVRRYDIKSPWTAAITSVDGNYSYSPFVVIESRGT